MAPLARNHLHLARTSGAPARLVKAALAVPLMAAGALLAMAPAFPASAASASPLVSAPSHTIAGAPALVLKSQQSGGGGPIDFWTIKLAGGDQMQLNVGDPSDGNFTFALYAPGTTDATFGQVSTVSSGTTPSTGFLTLQAPYTGTFVLAVCEDVRNSNCSNTTAGNGSSGLNPMNPYTFTPTLVGGGITGTKASGEVKAGASISKAPALTIGHFEAGGGNLVDFWKIKLAGGDQVSLNVGDPANGAYTFAFYAPSASDATFGGIPPLSSGTTPSSGFLTLQAPYTGTFVLAVCEDARNNNCSNTTAGNGSSGINPVNPYTFTPTLVGGGITGTKASGEVKAGASISKAPALTIGHFEAGGGNLVDFWKIKLAGGDQVSLNVGDPANGAYTFAFYAPNASDATFGIIPPLSSGTTGTTGFLTLQAPYTGTFVLAVCEDARNSNCSNTTAGNGSSGINPVNPYTFTPTLVKGGITGTKASGEVKAGASISKAPALTIGHFEAGGGNLVDFWKIKLARGDHLRLNVGDPTNNSYTFSLYGSGTKDSNFGQASALSTGTIAANGFLTLQATRTGTLILAVCEDVRNNDCANTTAVNGASGVNPMNPYTYTLTFGSGPGTSLTLKLSESSVHVGSEKSLKISVAVSSQFVAHPAGTVTIRAGRKAICSVKLSTTGKGTCSPSSQTLLAAGKYSITGSIKGNGSFPPATSKAVKLTALKKN